MAARSESALPPQTLAEPDTGQKAKKAAPGRIASKSSDESRKTSAMSKQVNLREVARSQAAKVIRRRQAI
jgi:hypothetical protein